MRRGLARAHALVAVLALAGLAGCSAIAALDQAAEVLDVHELRGPLDIAAAPSPRRAILSVELPSASGAISTERILVRQGSTQVAYLPDARWSDDAPSMLQTAIVETLLRTNAFSFVGRRPIGPSGDLALVSTLVDFEARVVPGGDGATIEMTLVARLVREQDAAIVAGRTFARSVPVDATSTPVILAGYQAATDAILADLVAWVADVAR